MLVISSRGDYGLQIMLCLAKNYQKGRLSLPSIARSEGLPVKYLAQISWQLKKKKLIKSWEGKNGGLS
jgi:Rrf2 family cysteine metabolism transcriptional repressor